MRFFTLTTLLAITQYVAAQGVVVKFSSAVAGSPTTVTLSDAGGSPPLAQLANGHVQLYVGGWQESNSAPLVDLGVITYPGVLTVTSTFAASIASEITNGFYFKVTSAVQSGGTVINYSQRFSILGLTGTTDPRYVTAAQQAAAAPPAAIVNVQQAAAPAGETPAGAGAFTVPYNLQSGLTKYAPMQPVPPTKITKKNATPLFPTSAFTTAMTFLPPASIKTTVTQAQTFSVSSAINTAAAQSQPTGDMAKFLARWKD